MKISEKIYITTLIAVCASAITLTIVSFFFSFPLVVVPLTLAILSIMAIGQQILEHSNNRKENYKTDENTPLLTAKKNIPIIPSLDFSKLSNFQPTNFSFFKKTTYNSKEKFINDQNKLLNKGDKLCH